LKSTPCIIDLSVQLNGLIGIFPDWNTKENPMTKVNITAADPQQNQPGQQNQQPGQQTQQPGQPTPQQGDQPNKDKPAQQK
jgi:hypothetical protein